MANQQYFNLKNKLKREHWRVQPRLDGLGQGGSSLRATDQFQSAAY